MRGRGTLVVIALLLVVTFHKVRSAPVPLRGKASAVYELVNRVLGLKSNDVNYQHPFQLKLAESSSSELYFPLEDDDNDNNKIIITASTASELSAGVGFYLKEYCNMTFGWPLGGGSRIVIPKFWPKIGVSPVTKTRSVPWSYFMNVCTHSYSLVWYGKKDWEDFIDWMSLSGINLMLALTGQEQIQYETFRKFGLDDLDIRSWFNGPAFLTWSRGQNEYGSNICGPLPKSWMKDQFDLQKDFILPRLRELGIIGQLPGFQGNVPIQIKELRNDTNITAQDATGWMNSVDPFYGEIADVYMKILVQNFGTDHWYQLDGYFNGATAPWMSKPKEKSRRKETNNYGAQSSYSSHDEAWFQRGKAAYQGLNRTDPHAVWSFQGFSFIGWEKEQQAQALKGFIDAAPKDHFVILDMSYTGPGEYTKFNNSSFFGTPFIWTALHNFGGTDGIKGDISRLNHIPFDILHTSSIVGLGATPEGINQNPAYYEFLFEATFRDGPVKDLGKFMAHRSLKRYGLSTEPTTREEDAANYYVSKAWTLLTNSFYSNDFSTQDLTGVAHLNPRSPGLFEDNRYNPKPMLCDVFHAWESLGLAQQETSFFTGDSNETFRYDLINVAREVLAQLSTPAALNFSDSTKRQVLDQDELVSTGMFYIELLNDIDKLVATDVGFLLGPWLESSKKWGAKGANDCYSAILDGSDCQKFYEWNARTQITTWNPTPKNSPKILGGPVDYASKQWSGLIQDYYARRANILLGQALHDQAAGKSLNQTETDRLFAQHAYEWTTSTKKYPSSVRGDAFEIAREMYLKYKSWFSSCNSITSAEK